ncbi:MAG: hypothetical protein HY747_05100 [Elusimicrobia bacterium]|nr:hypothetical protein [Elusimicrobiota bacterium]
MSRCDPVDPEHLIYVGRRSMRKNWQCSGEYYDDEFFHLVCFSFLFLVVSV